MSATLRRARDAQPVTVSSVTGALDMLHPGEYQVEDAGMSVRLHSDLNGGHTVAEVKMPAFDALLTQRQVVFLS
jgi:hypothetical protein